MIPMNYPISRSSWLKTVFDEQRQRILISVQATDPEDLHFDIFQANKAVEIYERLLIRLKNNPTTRSLDHAVLAMTAHMVGIMSAQPLVCRKARADYVDYVNINFAAISIFILFKLGNFHLIDHQVMRRFIMSFHGRATLQEPIDQSLGSDLERDLSCMLFFFEAYMRRGIGTNFKFRNPKRLSRFH
jgi:hypothetical protein